MQQRRVSPERVRRLTLFGCSRHPDAKPINKLQADQLAVSEYLSNINMILIFFLKLNCLEFISLLGVAVATTPRG